MNNDFVVYQNYNSFTYIRTDIIRKLLKGFFMLSLSLSLELCLYYKISEIKQNKLQCKTERHTGLQHAELNKPKDPNAPNQYHHTASIPRSPINTT